MSGRVLDGSRNSVSGEVRWLGAVSQLINNLFVSTIRDLNLVSGLEIVGVVEVYIRRVDGS